MDPTMRIETEQESEQRLPRPVSTLAAARGFTVVEVLVAAVILAVAIIGIAAVFPIGHQDVASSGQITMATASAQMALDGMQNLPAIANIRTLDGFNITTGTSTLPPAGTPERTLAQRWAFALTGNAVTWTPPAGSPEYTFGPNAVAPTSLGATGNIVVQCLDMTALPALTPLAPCPPDPWLVLVTISVTVPERSVPITVTRLISNSEWL